MSVLAQNRKLHFLLMGVACVTAPLTLNAAALTYSAGSTTFQSTWQSAVIAEPNGLVQPSGVVLQMAAYDTPRDSARIQITRPIESIAATFNRSVDSQSASTASSQRYGLSLPEPGTGSTLIATLGLAAFFFIRRAMR